MQRLGIIPVQLLNSLKRARNDHSLFEQLKGVREKTNFLKIFHAAFHTIPHQHLKDA